MREEGGQEGGEFVLLMVEADTRHMLRHSDSTYSVDLLVQSQYHVRLVRGVLGGRWCHLVLQLLHVCPSPSPSLICKICKLYFK